MKLAIIHLWILACLTYGFAIFMAFQGRPAATIFLSTVYLVILISTRWITENGED